MAILKNIANTLLAITLLIATTGVTINKHYCMGRLKSMAINEHAAHCFSGEEEQMPCCKDVSEELKVEEITTTGFDFDATPDLYQLAVVSFVLLDAIELDTESEKSYFQHYSPPVPDTEIYILNKTFLI